MALLCVQTQPNNMFLAHKTTIGGTESLLLDAQVSFSRIHELAFRTERKLLTRVNLFDVYEGDKIEKGKKSYAVSFILQDKEATLRDDRIDKSMQELTEVFRKELGAELR